MVYPPPPPQTGRQHEFRSPLSEEGKGVSLPSMGSWAPPPPGPSPRTSQASPGWASGPPPISFPAWRDPQVTPGSAGRGAKRSGDDSAASGTEEVEAGLALAGLGLGLTAGEMMARRDSMTKRSKPDEEKTPKDGRKSCSECRRLKAKCDRVFPCSNCGFCGLKRWSLADEDLGRRRGCALVCPDGNLSCMQGKRLVLASTEQLHDRVSAIAEST